MNWKATILLLAIPVLNVTLNTLAQLASGQRLPWFRLVQSPHFLLAFVLGSVSLIFMVLLYEQDVPLPRGILMMGAMSILGGSLWGMYYKNLRFDTGEWLLFAAIFLFLLLRFLNLSGPK